MQIRPLGDDGRTDGRTNIHDKANRCFSRLCESACNEFLYL